VVIGTHQTEADRLHNKSLVHQTRGKRLGKKIAQNEKLLTFSLSKNDNLWNSPGFGGGSPTKPPQRGVRKNTSNPNSRYRQRKRFFLLFETNDYSLTDGGVLGEDAASGEGEKQGPGPGSVITGGKKGTKLAALSCSGGQKHVHKSDNAEE